MHGLVTRQKYIKKIKSHSTEKFENEEKFSFHDQAGVSLCWPKPVLQRETTHEVAPFLHLIIIKLRIYQPRKKIQNKTKQKNRCHRLNSRNSCI